MSKLGANNQEVLTKLYILKFGRIFQRKKRENMGIQICRKESKENGNREEERVRKMKNKGGK